MTTRTSRRAGACSTCLGLCPRRLIRGRRYGHAIIGHMRWQESESRRSRRRIIRAERPELFGQRGHIESSDRLLSTRIQHGVFVNVHKNATFLERLGTVLHQKEIKRFGQRSGSRGTEQFGCNCGRIGIATPDDTEILKHVWVDVCRRWDRPGQFCDGRGRNIQNSWGILREPRMNKNVGYLTGKNRLAEEYYAKKPNC